MILWGPPGTGKTTLAEVIARYANADVERISAVTSGVKEIREAIERARQNRNAGRRTILFVDEVHRFNKSQQDAFLPQAVGMVAMSLVMPLFFRGSKPFHRKTVQNLLGGFIFAAAALAYLLPEEERSP